MKQGFTLVEIMIVTMIIGFLAAIAVPNFLAARQRAAQSACIDNLRQIFYAKNIWAIDLGKSDSAQVVWTDLVPNYLKKQPACPALGVYNINTVAAEPTCNIAGHAY